MRAAAALGYTLTLEELERSVAEMQELDPDELFTAAGGNATDEKATDEKGHDAACITAWHCFIVTLHTEAKEKRVACWSDYTCLDLYNLLPEKEKST